MIASWFRFHLGFLGLVHRFQRFAYGHAYPIVALHLVGQGFDRLGSSPLLILLGRFLELHQSVFIYS